MKICHEQIWIVGSVPAQIAIEICEELNARSKERVRPDPIMVKIMAQTPNNDGNIDRLANGGRDPDVRKAQLLHDK
jgi:hypothetical protein